MAIDVPQLFDCAKSSAWAPVTAIEANVTAAMPVFVRLMDWAADLLPAMRSPKAKDAALILMFTDGVPVPDNDTRCGEPVAESVMVSVADLAPAETGVKIMEMLQAVPTARDGPQLFDCAKSSAWAPVTPMAANVTAAAPLFVRVMDWAADRLPAARLPKAKDPALMLRLRVGMPVPDNDTCCGEPLAESVIARLADFAPMETGAKKIEMLQAAPAASEVPQLFDCAKSSACPPVTAIEANVTAAVPPFVRVMGCDAELVLVSWLPNARFVGDTVIGPVVLEARFSAIALWRTASCMVQSASAHRESIATFRIASHVLVFISNVLVQVSNHCR